MTNRMIISPSSVSFNQIKRDYISWASNLPGYDAFRYFYEDEAGDIIMDMCSGLGAYTMYNVLSATEETYLFYTKTRESAIAITGMNSYNVYRGRNDILQVRVVPSRNVSLTKLEPCGLLNGVSVSPLENYTLLQGEPITLKLVVGDVEQEEIVCESAGLANFRFIEPKVSMDVRLLLNNVDVPFSTNVLDMINDYYYIQTNPYGSVDVQYQNNNLLSPMNPYTTGDTLKLLFVKLMNVIYSFPDDVKLDFGVIDDGHVDTVVWSAYKSPESLVSIQVNGPLYNETRKTIRAREDYPKWLKQLNVDFTDTNSRDVNIPVIYLGQKRNIPGFLDVTYVKYDNSLLSVNERAALIQSMNANGARAHNIPEAEIVDPHIVNTKLNISFIQRSGTDASTWNQDLVDILSKYEDFRGFKKNREQKLGFDFSLRRLEYDLERLEYVEIARASVATVTWNSNTVYKRGEFILPTTSNGFMFEVISNTYTYDMLNNVINNTGLNSGLVEPTWNLVSGGYTYSSNIPGWQASTSYAVDDIVKTTVPMNRVFKAVQVTGNSGAVEPTWGVIQNELTTDGGVTWMTIDPIEVDNSLIYKTYPLDAYSFKCAWNEYYVFEVV